MPRHFLSLYLLIVLTLTAASWGQDKLLEAYGTQGKAAGKPPAVSAFENQLHSPPTDQWKHFAGGAAKTGVETTLFTTMDIAGRETLNNLKLGQIPHIQSVAGEPWAKPLSDNDVVALKPGPGMQRGLLDWTLKLFFCAAIALVITFWIWPPMRDLRALEKAASGVGNKDWMFDARIKPRSKIYPLAETFRKLAARIDALIASRNDMSDAVSHEIKTPLSRMRFEVESAQQAENVVELKRSLGNIKTDIAAISNLVQATMDYAILERADMSLNIGEHNFTTLIPAIAESVRCNARPEIRMRSAIQNDADKVICDMNLLETVLKNLLYNAARYAKRDIRISFNMHNGVNQLLVDDDGPGIPEKDRHKALESFVQLNQASGKKMGFGLGLAIVKRVIEWHSGEVSISRSPLGGARIAASWPAILLHH
jgi:two-component system, OmpR family, sensor kinase